MSSFKSHCFGLIKHCGIVLLLLLLIFFNKAPTDPFLPYPAKVSQVTPLHKFALLLPARRTALPQGAGPRFNQFCLNSECLSSHQQSDVGNAQRKASNYSKLSEIIFLVLRTKRERNSRGEAEDDGRDRESLNSILHLVNFSG